MLHRFLVIVGIALFVMACSDNPADNTTDPPQGGSFENKDFIRATVNGSTYTAILTASDGSINEGVVTFTVGGNGAAGALTLTGSVSGTGTFTLGSGTDAGSLSLTIIQSPTSIVFYSTGDGATGTLIVDKFDLGVKRLKGRFSGTMKTSAGATMEVKDGTFEGKWS